MKIRSVRPNNINEEHEAYKLIDKITGYTDNLSKEIKNGYVNGLFINNHLVGVYRVRPLKRYLQLDALYIKQPFRKCGYGKALLKHAERLCKKLKYKSIRLWTNTNYGTVYKFYNKCGYVLRRFAYENEFEFEKELV